jgi:HEAT repeats
MEKTRARKGWLLGAAVIAGLAGLAWWQHTPALTWYYLHELAAADADSRATWVARVASLDVAAVPGLLEHLESRDPTVCTNAQDALVALVRRWGAADPRTHAVVEEMRHRFGGMSGLGQISSLEVMTEILQDERLKTWPAALTGAAAELLHASEDRPGLRATALVLAGVLLDRVPPGQCLDSCHVLADKGLTDRLPRARLAAVRLLMRPGLQGAQALLAKVVPLLRDAEAPVRRAALVALAPAPELVREDDLLPLLHDPDLEVQRLCEAALRSRGLGDAHLDLARLLCDDSPKARLKVLERLGRVDDVDPSAWLRRLSQDPCSAIRAAAVRAAAQHPRADLTDRLREMSQQDPSETVRQNAKYYLSQR